MAKPRNDNLIQQMSPLGRRTSRATAVLFCVFVVAVPVVQLAVEVCQQQPRQEFDLFKQFPTLERIESFERALERASVVAGAVRPWVQWVFTRVARRGNEKVVVGRDNWLFYRPSVEHVLGPRFFGQAEATADSPPAGTPLAAILHFRDQLEALGIDLVLVPMPSKETVCPEQLTGTYWAQGPADSADTGRLLTEIQRHSIPVLDATALLRQASRRSPQPLYLPDDTHWTPAGMDLIARELAAQLAQSVYLEGASPRRYVAQRKQITNRGDLYDMLDLPQQAPLFAPTTVTLEPVAEADSGRPWQPDPQSPILLLGDSFTNIYSDPKLHWGEHAGLAEHLSLHLGHGVDVIALNDGGVNGCRERLARSPVFLQGKKLVIWQFATRDFRLKARQWKNIPIRSPEPRG